MKKSLKSISLLMALCMTLGLMSGCGGSEEAPAQTTAPETTETTAPATTETTTPEATGTAWPEKAVEVVIPVAAGGPSDVSGRLAMKYLEAELGQSFVPINVSGSGGSLGMTEVKNSAADGYTMVYFHLDLISNCVLGTVDYNWDDALDPAGTANSVDTMSLLVAGDAPYDTVQEFVDYAKAQDKAINLATEYGTDNLLFMMQFADVAGININPVDLGGAANRVAAMKGKQIDVTCMPYKTAYDYIQTGDFKCLGIFASERSEFFPDVPTVSEQGYEVVYQKYHLFAFPDGTPQEIVDKFDEALTNVMNNPDYIAELGEAVAFKAEHLDPAETTAMMKDVEAAYIPIAEALMG